MRLVAIDPGTATGWAATNIPDPDQPLEVEHGQWFGVRGFRATAPILIGHSDVAMVIAEDFKIYPHMQAKSRAINLSPVKELGRIELACLEHQKSLKLQMASQAKQQWPNRRFKKHFAKLYRECKTEHEKDAIRHLLTYIENQKLRTFFKLEDAI